MNIYSVSIVFCLAFVFITVELIRRQKIAERYALLWLSLGLVMVLLSLFPKLLQTVAELLGIFYAPSLLFLIGSAFALLLIMHVTMVISRLHRKVTRLIQELALLKAALGDDRDGRSDRNS
ncbi:DUF2304 domain-containing protein [Paenibacillus contaminans]|uniref:DUF2304 domain-containing protein n=1 Tax=Paenibacillus contaminans TaxID=450362 RepID=A0A329MJN0_9BACL|nr:DUF2304 domain-containing protein [Paenibacillus contaminans]RAV19852.1 DUF2304 domain-containing protein [Paenibacillus contaminans]